MSRGDGDKRGVFIVLEGGDGTGKTTQAERAVEHIRKTGREATLVREPGGTRVGEKVRAILLDPDLSEMGVRAELFLYMAARAQLVREVIEPALDEGKVVVADRYLLSSVVYQGVAGGIGSALVREVGSLAVGGIQPDLTIVLDVPVEVAEGRRGAKKDRMEGKGRDFHEKVQRGYVQAATRGGEKVRLVSADGSVDDVASRVMKEIDRVLG